MPATTTNERLKAWVDEWAAVVEPDAIHAELAHPAKQMRE